MCAVPVKNVIEVAESSSINPLPAAPTFVAGIKKFTGIAVAVPR